jgi:hypothetical protein
MRIVPTPTPSQAFAAWLGERQAAALRSGAVRAAAAYARALRHLRRNSPASAFTAVPRHAQGRAAPLAQAAIQDRARRRRRGA